MNSTNIEVWHLNRTDSNFELMLHGTTVMPKNLNTDYVRVAQLDIKAEDELEALQKCFEFTQTEKSDWREFNLRSTSVGDIMMIIDTTCNVGIKAYSVSPIGFKLLFDKNGRVL